MSWNNGKCDFFLWLHKIYQPINMPHITIVTSEDYRVVQLSRKYKYFCKPHTVVYSPLIFNIIEKHIPRYISHSYFGRCPRTLPCENEICLNRPKQWNRDLVIPTLRWKTHPNPGIKLVSSLWINKGLLSVLNILFSWCSNCANSICKQSKCPDRIR